tara:strand:- start:2453 stop:2977 length:525 start_codon:yes stop_codon:yes gene_type:complete
MVNIKEEFSKNQTILLLMSSVEYNDVILDTLKQLEGASISYVSLNKTYPAVKENLKNNGVNTDNIVFIDCISKTVMKRPPQAENCYYISSPGALTEISIAISKFLRHGFNYVIFDSLTSLLVYNTRIKKYRVRAQEIKQNLPVLENKLKGIKYINFTKKKKKSRTHPPLPLKRL